MTFRARKLAVLGLTATGLIGATAALAPAAQAASSAHGCPSGYFCIYPENAGWNNNHPSHEWKRYGYDNLSGQVGTHNVYNNQTGQANGYLCYGYNATGGFKYGYPPGSSNSTSLTKINSVLLTPGIDKNPCQKGG